MAYNRKGYIERAKQIQAIAQEHYEPGRQDRCLKWVWRKHIEKQFGMCYITFLKYYKVDVSETSEPEPENKRQLKLF